MNATISYLKRHSLTIGLALMFLYTWPIDLANSGVLHFEVPFAVYITLGWGFIFVSLLMTWLVEGKTGAVRLLKRFLIWRVGWLWYLAALGLFPALFAAAVWLSAVLNQAPVDFSAVFARQIFGPDVRLPVLIIPLFLFDAITNGEEMGWRGYVLPRLQAKYSALASSLILGVIWGFWHLPKLMAPDSTASIAPFMVKVMADAVLYTWLYNGTRGSLLLATLFHASANTAGMLLPLANGAPGAAGDAYLVTVGLVALAAALAAMRAGPALLSREEKPAWITGS